MTDEHNRTSPIPGPDPAHGDPPDDAPRDVQGYAAALIAADTVAGKLAPPPRGLPDRPEHTPALPDAPGRPRGLEIRDARAVKVPRPAGMRDRNQRARILHALANHELQAVELFAWALLAFPDMPGSFRRGLLAILCDEQRHLQLYIDRVEALGARFGDCPVTGHFWNKLDAMTTPLAFACTMGLTFENANLDLGLEYLRWAEVAGDVDTQAALRQVHDDEIRHVRFAWRWLERLRRPEVSAWQTYIETIRWPLGPERARGRAFDEDSRVRAGLDREFIANLAAIEGRRPNGRPR